jgi:hypothetical protein
MYYISIDAQENELSDGAKIIKKVGKNNFLGQTMGTFSPTY